MRFTLTSFDIFKIYIIDYTPYNGRLCGARNNDREQILPTADPKHETKNFGAAIDKTYKMLYTVQAVKTKYAGVVQWQNPSLPS